MCKRLFFLISIILVLGLVGNASAALVGRWTFDDGTANDSGGGGHHGTLTSGDETTSISIVYDADRDSNVLELNNPAAHTINSVVNCGAGEWADITSQITIAMWAKIDTAHESSYLITKGIAYQIHQLSGALTSLDISMDGLTPGFLEDRETTIEDGWHHVAVTFDSIADKRFLYINGAPVKSDSPSGEITTNADDLLIGGRLDDETHRGWDGWLDDVQLYDRALSEGEIRWMNGMYSAYNPNPENEEEYVSVTLPSLTWQPGAKVADVNGHKLYFGTSQALVEANDVSVYIGALDSNSYTGAPMASLALGTTYYWRVIEVNGIDEWPDEVWEFSTAPLKATEPDPLDGAKYVGISRTKVGWRAGVGAANHAVYYGTDETLVTNGDASVYKGTFPVIISDYNDPNWPISPALISGKTYYWRVDVNAPGVYQGDVWSFETMAPTGDPNLIGWWKLDETSKDGKHVFDASGNEHHGTLEIPDEAYPIEIVYDPERDSNVAFFPFWNSTAINCGGGGGTGTWADFTGDTMTIAAFFKVKGLFPGVKYPYVAAKENAWRISRWSDTRHMRFFMTTLGGDLEGSETADDGEWHHIAGVYDGTTKYLYWDGELDVTESASGPIVTTTWDVMIGGNQANGERVWDGWISDVRLFDRALTRREIALMGVKDPNQAWWPYPAHNAVDVSDRPLILTWESGNNVAATGGHRVYFGTDKALVDANDASVDNGPQDVNYLDVGELAFDTTYYWRVDESNGATTWRGLDWTYDMANFKLFDDFESYGFGIDDLINSTWELVDWTGGAINLGMSINTEPVNTGEQSMKYEYDNQESGFYYHSEVYRDFGGSPQDWSYATGDVKSLQLNFYGETGNNPDDMYVVLDDGSNESMKLYDGDLDDLKAGEWKEWDIDLSWFTDGANNVNLASVQTVYLGFGERGTLDWPDPHLAGTVYFDDFRVYPPRCVPSKAPAAALLSGDDCLIDEKDVDAMAADWLDGDYTILTPLNPGDANLIAWWSFDDGTADDNSPGGLHDGTIRGTVTIVEDANIIGAGNKVAYFPGGEGNDISCGGGGAETWADDMEQITIAAWVQIDEYTTEYQYIAAKEGSWRIMRYSTTTSPRFYTEGSPTSLLGYTDIQGGDWHHICCVSDGTTKYIYIDGLLENSVTREQGIDNSDPNIIIGGTERSDSLTRMWKGFIDDVRLYDDALTQAEVMFLAGHTGPAYNPIFSPANLTDAGDPCNLRFVNYKDFDILADGWLTDTYWP